MSKRIVDNFEPVEVEAQDCELSIPIGAMFNCLVQAIMEKDPISQLGERVVPSQKRYLGIGGPFLGYVFMCFNPSAIAHGTVRNGDDAAICQFQRVIDGLALPNNHKMLVRLCQEKIGRAVCAQRRREKFLCRCIRRKLICAYAVDFQEMLVYHREPVSLVKHAQALRHVVKGGIEEKILLPEGLFFLDKRGILLKYVGSKFVTLFDRLRQEDYGARNVPDLVSPRQTWYERPPITSCDIAYHRGDFSQWQGHVTRYCQ